MRRPLLPLLLAAALLAPAAAHGGMLDQQQTATANDISVASGLSRAQTFTAGLTGKLDQVDLFIKQMNSPTQPLTVAIQTVTGTPAVPSGTVLASVSFPAASVPTTEQFVSILFPIASAASVTMATQYAIVLSTTEATGVYLWYGTPTNTYAVGSGFYSTGGAWLADANVEDFTFKTYVVVAAAVTLRGTTAIRTNTGVLVRWRTTSELDVLGFNVYRQANGKRVRVNPRLIGAYGRGFYSFLDRKAPRAKPLRYWIQVVHLDGSRTWYGPARAVGAAAALR